RVEVSVVLRAVCLPEQNLVGMRHASSLASNQAGSSGDARGDHVAQPGVGGGIGPSRAGRPTPALWRFQQKMLTPPGPIKRPTTIRPIPYRTPPRTSITIPEITKIAAMIQ